MFSELEANYLIPANQYDESMPSVMMDYYGVAGLKVIIHSKAY